MNSHVFSIEKSYKLVPPNGGYGYLVLAAVSLIFIAIHMFVPCLGMIFRDFYKTLGMASTTVSVLAGINSLSVSLSVYMTGPLLKVMSRRKLALIGSVIYNSGAIGTVFANTQTQLIMCQGLLQNFGYGFLYNVSITMLNDYFPDKSLFCISFAHTLSALAVMVAPMVVSWSMAAYGFRGTLIVISAVSLQTFVASALLQPVSWHMKKVVVEDENKLLFLQTEKPVNDHSDKLLQNPVVKTNDIENGENLFPENKDNIKPSIANIAITWIENFLDWPLFKQFALTCAGLGAPVVLFADMTTAVYFLAQFLYDLSWNSDQVKWAFSLIGSGDIAAKVFLIISSSWLKRLGSHPIYVAGILLAIVTRLGLLWVTDYAWSLAIITVMGMSRCFLLVLYPMAITDTVGPEQFPSAMGISMMIYGIISIVLGPVVGAIRDATGSYKTMFLILIALMIATAVAWIIELLRGRQKITQESEID